MSPKREPAEDQERDAFADLHREASRAVDERPDPRVRERVLAAAREAQEFNRLRAKQARQRSRGRGFGSPRDWPRSAVAVLVVAVIAAYAAGRVWPEASETVAPARDAAAPTAAVPAAAAPAANVAKIETTSTRTIVDGDAIARARRPDRRAFSRDRDDPVIVVKAAVLPPPKPAFDEGRAREERAALADAPSVPADEGRRFAAEAAPPVAARASSPAASAGVTAFETPEAWSAWIAQLRREGRGAAADGELARLLQRYPDFVVPAEAAAPPR